jgi:hypothetical protein
MFSTHSGEHLATVINHRAVLLVDSDVAISFATANPVALALFLNGLG